MEFKVGDKVQTSYTGFTMPELEYKVYTVTAVSTWAEVLNIPNYIDLTAAYQLDDNSWWHAQYMRHSNQ